MSLRELGRKLFVMQCSVIGKASDDFSCKRRYVCPLSLLATSPPNGSPRPRYATTNRLQYCERCSRNIAGFYRFYTVIESLYSEKGETFRMEYKSTFVKCFNLGQFLRTCVYQCQIHEVVYKFVRVAQCYKFKY